MVPYAVDGLLDADGGVVRIHKIHERGLDLYLDPSQISAEDAERIKRALKDALDSL